MNAYMVSANFISKKGKRLENFASDKEKAIKMKNGIKNKNKQRSEIRPTVFTFFVQANANTIKKKPKENKVGAVSKNAA